MWYGMHNWMFGGMWMFPLGVLIIIVILIYLFARKNDGNVSLPKEESALEILKKRYAKGEITKEEFERLKRDIVN